MLLGTLFIKQKVPNQPPIVSIVELVALLPVPQEVLPAAAPSKSLNQLKKLVKKAPKGIVKKKIKKKSIAEESSTLEIQKRTLAYAEELNLYLLKYKKYPHRALKLRQSGVVKLKVLISPQGEFKNVEIIGPSSFKILNKAAKSLLTKLQRFKPLPKGYKGTGEFVIPVSYKLQGS